MVVIAKFFQLFLVKFDNGFLDRDGAGHGCLFTQSCGCGAQRKTGNVPDRMKGRRPYAIFDNQLFESSEMLVFLLCHMADGVCRFCAIEYSQLACVNTLCAEL